MNKPYKKSLWDRTEDVLREHMPDLFDQEKEQLLRGKARDAAERLDEHLIRALLNEPACCKHFFKKIDRALVFCQKEFLNFIDSKHLLDDSYTAFKNKIGLTVGGKLLAGRDEVSLVWPYKDCVLEGGMSQEEKERDEIFFNTNLAKDEIYSLLDDKVLTSAERYDQDGNKPTASLKRDENGTIRDNLIIKGNNLIALHSLKKQFAGKVKLIYIDPPYNTQNDSFKYNDKFNHSTWLTFMKNRLEAARILLRDDGVIFVQGDDNEQAYLKVLMDEVFGRGNFIGSVITRATPNARDYGGIARMHEYIHIYAQTYSKLKMYELPVTKEFKYQDNVGKFNIHPLYNSNSRFNKNTSPTLFYPFYLNTELVNGDHNFHQISMSPQDDWEEVYPPKLRGTDIEGVWRWGKEKSKEELNKDIIGYKTQEGEYKKNE